MKILTYLSLIILASPTIFLIDDVCTSKIGNVQSKQKVNEVLTKRFKRSIDLKIEKQYFNEKNKASDKVYPPAVATLPQELQYQDVKNEYGIPTSPQSIRLRSTNRTLPYNGQVEVLKSNNWGALCDGYWNHDAAQVACNELGFIRGALHAVRFSKYGEMDNFAYSRIICSGHEKKIMECNKYPSPECLPTESAGVQCISDGGCEFGWYSYDGMCYKVISESVTHEEAVKNCSEMNAKPLFILSNESNNFVSDLLHLSYPEMQAVWTGAEYIVITDSENNKFAGWEWRNTNHVITSTNAKLWFPGFYDTSSNTRPLPEYESRSCVAMTTIFDNEVVKSGVDTQYFWWDNISCKQKLPFICQKLSHISMDRSRVDDELCFDDNGAKYRGTVRRTISGTPCKSWKNAPLNPNNSPEKGLGDHNYCRNPDNDTRPWCWTVPEDYIYGYCQIDKCGNNEISIATAVPPPHSITPGFGQGSCIKDLFYCPSMNEYNCCFDKKLVCDGKKHCLGNEDEALEFCKTYKCSKDQFYCQASNYCINKRSVCDGIPDCIIDRADEMNCSKSEKTLVEFKEFLNKKFYSSKATTRYYVQNLERCANLCQLPATRTSYPCLAFNYRPAREGVSYSECELLSDNNTTTLVSDAEFNFYSFLPDCGKAQNTFRCNNSRCVREDLKCNGLNECGDNSDEDKCKEINFGISPFVLRLSGGKGNWEGRIEVRYQGQWGIVCDNGFGLPEASVVCKQLGFPGAVEVISRSRKRFGAVNAPFLLDAVQCTGSEKNITACKHNEWYRHNCDITQVTGVVCATNRACTSSEFRCGTNDICISIKNVCDGKRDCDDNSDERSCKDLVRLTGGPISTIGRIEIQVNNILGTVCDDQFTDIEATVFCRMMGFNINGRKLPTGMYSSGIGVIWLDDLKCQGNENNFRNCSFYRWADSDCSHKEDVAIECNYQIPNTTRSPLIQRVTTMKLSTIPKEQTTKRRLPITPTAASSKVMCGQRKFGQQQSTGRVVGGFEAQYGAYPWQIGIRKRKNNYHIGWCGGTIINEWWIITAAHCFQEPKENYFIRVGDLNNEKEDQYEQTFEIDQLLKHPRWTGPPQYDYDLTLIKISSPNGRGIQFNDYISPACLPDVNTRVSTSIRCHASGWGSTGGAKMPNILQAIEIPLINDDECRTMYKSLTPRMQCAGFREGGIDTCQGDSGGPLVCELGSQGNEYVLWGATSFGSGCAMPNSPGVYAKVISMMDWINQYITH